MNQPMQPPPDIVRTNGTVVDGQAAQLARLQGKARALRLLPVSVSTGVAWFAFRAVQSHPYKTMGEHLGAAALAGILLTVLVAIVLAVVLAIRQTTLRKEYAAKMPAGAPMSAEFNPGGISVQVGGYQDSVALDDIARIETTDQALVLTPKPAGKRHRNPVLVPHQLVPPHIVDGLKQRFKS